VVVVVGHKSIGRVLPMDTEMFTIAADTATAVAPTSAQVVRVNARSSGS
jgi:hypothetical protein